MATISTPQLRHEKVILTPKQAMFFGCRNREVLFSGAVRAAKTRALCYKALFHAQPKGARVGLFRRYFADMKASTLRTLLEPDGHLPPVIPAGSYTHNLNLHRISLKDGGEITYFGFDRISSLGSTAYNWIGVDEGHELSQEHYMFLIHRLSHPIGHYRQVAVATNPGPPSHFLHKRFLEDGLEMGAEPSRVTCAQPQCRWLHATTYDNPFLPEDYIKSLISLDRQSYRRYVLGLWIQFEGLVYSEFDRDENMLDRWEFNRELPSYIFLDFGYRRPAALFVQKDTRTTPSRYIVFDEIIPENCSRQELLKLIRRKNYPLWQAWGDPAGDAKDDSGVSTIQYFRDNGLAVNYSTETKTRSIPAGVELVRSLICNADGVRRLFTVRTCTKFLQALESYHYPIKEGVDLPVKDGISDHPMDALRYGLVNVEKRAPNLKLLKTGGGRVFPK